MIGRKYKYIRGQWLIGREGKRYIPSWHNPIPFISVTLNSNTDTITNMNTNTDTNTNIKTNP